MWFKRIILSVFAAIAAISGYALDLVEAFSLCDATPLHSIEGIWHFTDDDITVLILRSPDAADKYTITVVEADDWSLPAGTVLGTLSPTTDVSKFKLSLFTKVKKGILSAPASMAATLTSDGEAIAVEGMKLKISLNPTRLLPNFWRLLRIRLTDPAGKLPRGLRKLYPSYDGNGSSRRQPRYL